jgi:putative ABC transport system ATP-binding protein
VGWIVLADRRRSGLPEGFHTAVRRRTFGFIFQQFNLIKGLSVLENVMLPAYPLGGPRHALEAGARRLLAQFGLADKAAYRAEWLSGGEAQRTAICRALINGPQVLIADEPTANLDTALSRDFMRIVGELKAAGKTVLLTSHDPEVYDAPQVDRVIEMRDGRVVGG